VGRKVQGLLKKEARLYCLIFEQGHYFQTNFKIETFGYTLKNMEDWIAPHLTQLLAWLAFPEHGLSTVFLISFISATLLPLGSEPAVFGLIKLNPDLFWAAILVATAGNTLGGIVSWWMGYGAHQALNLVRKRQTQTGPARSSWGEKFHGQALAWLEKLGPKACLLSWLPGVGDPLCAVAGWLKMPLLPCAIYMAIGKLLRYVVMTSLLLWVF
jgi:membrane protein YqaA with SNARE-associated domain